MFLFQETSFRAKFSSVIDLLHIFVASFEILFINVCSILFVNVNKIPSASFLCVFLNV